MRPVDNPIWTSLYRDLEGDSFALAIAMEVMAGKPKDMTPEEARLKEAEVLERLAAVYAEIARGPGAAPLPLPQRPVTGIEAGNWANLPLTDAIIEYLKTCKGPKSPRQIWDALEAAGCEVASETPVRSVQWALKKAASTNSDVIAAGWGHWDIKSKYSKAKLERLLAKRSGRGGRSSDEHKRRTLIGMENARKHGKQIGARVKMTPEVMNTIEQMLIAQRKVADIATEVGVSKALIYGHFTVGRRDGKQTVERREMAGSPPLRLVK